MPFIPPPLPPLDLFPPEDRERIYAAERARLERLAAEYGARARLLTGVVVAIAAAVLMAIAAAFSG